MMPHPALRYLAGSLTFWILLVFSILFAGNNAADGHLDGLAMASVPEISERALATAPILPDIPPLSVETSESGPGTDPSEPEAAVADDTQETPAATPRREIHGHLRAGENLDAALKRHGVRATVRGRLIKALRSSLDLRRLHPGDQFVVLFDAHERLAGFSYQSGPLDIYTIADSGNGLVASREPVHLECRTTGLSGTIDTSLIAAFTNLGEQTRLVYAFADIFASKIDFNTETRQQDRFSLVVEKYYKDEVFVKYGRILAAGYETGNIRHEAYFFTSEQAGAGYFDRDGKEVGTSFIRSPIPFSRVSSKFSFQRKHPILGVTRPHLGVDLAAPSGTPVMAVADGKVVMASRNGGYGLQVIINHGNGYRTHYGHLSGFKKGLLAGATVKQKDIIGYVGATGLATGPHLDYRIEQNGEFKNPFDLKFKARNILTDSELALFAETTGEYIALLQADDEQRILQVKNITIPSASPPYLL